MTPPASLPKIAVIGAGWAGLAAAEMLCGQAELTVFEAGRSAGGRARTLAAGNGFAAADNGQHILLGAYRQTLALLARCGVAETDAFLRLPVTWHLADGLKFAAKNLPAPFHLLAGILTAKGITLGEKAALLKQMHRLRQLHPNDDISVGIWLRRENVCRRLQQTFWQPLVWAAMNTPLENASLQRLHNVLCDGIWGGRRDSDMLLPKRDLGSLFAEPVCRRIRACGGNIRLETRVPAVETALSGSLNILGSRFDAVILATAPYHAAALLPETLAAAVRPALEQLNYHAITTVYLRYPAPPTLPAPICGLAEGTAQWLIDRHSLGLGLNETAAVISLSDRYGRLRREDWINRVHADLLRLCPDLPEAEAALVISEKRATAAAVADFPALPAERLRRHRIYLAGDYLHPRYPATLEAAVQSGRTAAALLCADLLRSTPPADKPV